MSPAEAISIVLGVIRIVWIGNVCGARIETQLHQAQTAVIIIPEVALQVVVEQRHALQSPVAINVNIDVQQVFADVIKP